jgi:hypothetical protein
LCSLIFVWIFLSAKGGSPVPEPVNALPETHRPKSRILVTNQELISQEQRKTNWLILYTGTLASGGHELRVFVEYQGEISGSIQQPQTVPIRDIENYYSGQTIHITVAQAYDYSGPPGKPQRAVRWGSSPADPTASYGFDTKMTYKARLIFITDSGDRQYFYFMAFKKLPPCRGLPSCPDNDLDEEITIFTQNDLNYTQWFTESQ